MPEEKFGISTGEAEVNEAGEIVIPTKFRGVNNPETFCEVYNTGRENLQAQTKFFDFALELLPLILKALRKSK